MVEVHACLICPDTTAHGADKHTFRRVVREVRQMLGCKTSCHASVDLTCLSDVQWRLALHMLASLTTFAS